MLPTYADALGLAARSMSERSLAHAERVSREAESIARRYGVDADRARIAGLLHDWHRDTAEALLVERALASGIEVTDADRAVPYLLHGPLAAHDLPEVFPGLDAEVLDAVSCHTCGAGAMSPLAMVVYIADVIEPDRDHPGVEALREAAGRLPLEELFAQAYAASVLHIVHTRRHLHPVTVETWNRYVAGGKP